MKILVVGGAGYIGSHTAARLKEQDHEVLIYDNLSQGHAAAAERIGVSLIQGDVNDEERLVQILTDEKIEGVMHFAAFIEAGRSMRDPAAFFRNNNCRGIALIEAMRQTGVDKIIFSSTAAVYGEPQSTPIQENHPLNPTNFYGQTKIFFEKLLHWYHQLFDIKSISLRYFNASGASLEYDIGEDHRPETHIIPLLMETALGKREEFSLFGTDYPTRDGTCVRDYIHVDDLAEAHILAIEALNSDKELAAYNLGSGSGYSCLEIINMVKEISGQDFSVQHAPRRPGDPATLIASSEKIQKDLGWQPQHGLREIIESAYHWHQQNPEGFPD